eukprot:1098110_1
MQRTSPIGTGHSSQQHTSSRFRRDRSGAGGDTTRGPQRSSVPNPQQRTGPHRGGFLSIPSMGTGNSSQFVRSRHLQTRDRFRRGRSAATVAGRDMNRGYRGDSISDIDISDIEISDIDI